MLNLAGRVIMISGANRGVQVTALNQMPCGLNVKGWVSPTMPRRPHPSGPVVLYRLDKHRLPEIQHTKSQG